MCHVVCHINFINPCCFYSPEEEWNNLLELSPLFQLLKGVERQLKGWACGAGILRGEFAGRSDSVGAAYFWLINGPTGINCMQKFTYIRAHTYDTCRQHNHQIFIDNQASSQINPTWRKLEYRLDFLYFLKYIYEYRIRVPLWSFVKRADYRLADCFLSRSYFLVLQSLDKGQMVFFEPQVLRHVSLLGFRDLI